MLWPLKPDPIGGSYSKLLSHLHCLKDKVAILSKPDSLQELIHMAVQYNMLYWEHQAEWRLTHHYDPKATTPWLDLPWTPTSPTTTTPTTTWNATLPPCQSKPPQTTLHAPKPYKQVLGNDGKLHPEELKWWHKNKLCLVCGAGSHWASDCPSAWQGQNVELQLSEETETEKLEN